MYTSMTGKKTLLKWSKNQIDLIYSTFFRFEFVLLLKYAFLKSNETKKEPRKLRENKRHAFEGCLTRTKVRLIVRAREITFRPKRYQRAMMGKFFFFLRKNNENTQWMGAWWATQITPSNLVWILSLTAVQQNQSS